MQEKERIAHIISELEKLYPQDLCSLQYRIPHELLIAVRLSAQCTDARVNMVTPSLRCPCKPSGTRPIRQVPLH